MKTPKTARWCVVTMMLAAALAGCADQDATATPRNEAAPQAVPARPAPKQDNLKLADGAAASDTPNRDGDDGAGDFANNQRKLIQTGELRLEVAEYGEARAAIDAELKRLGGYVANAEVRHHNDKVSSATLTLRVPQQHFHTFLRGTAASGKVQHEALHTNDVTDAYIDAAARLKNARRLEARLLQLLESKTDGVKDLLEVERELARVRETIERHQGRLKMFDKQVGLSTLKLDLMTREVYAASTPLTLGNSVSRTFSGSLGLLSDAGRGLLLFAVALVPWLLPLLLLGFALIRGFRWLGRKGRAAHDKAQQRAAATAAAMAPQVYPGSQAAAAAAEVAAAA